MANLEPSKPRGLPFKRTVPKRDSGSSANDDGLSLFKRSAELYAGFEEQKKQAHDEAAKLKEERRKKRTEEEGEQAAALEAEEQLLRDSKSSKILQPDSDAHTQKRRRVSIPLSSDDEYVPSAKTKPEPISPRSPVTRRSLRSPQSALSKDKGKGKGKQIQVARLLDDSDDDLQIISSTKISNPSPSTGRGPVYKTGNLDDVDDYQGFSDPTAGIDAEDLPYLLSAKNRMAKRREERLDTNVTVLVQPRAEGMHIFKFLYKVLKPLLVARKTFIDYQRKKKSPLSEEELESIIFSWRGNRVWDSTTFESLGIEPDADGNVTSILDGNKVGYHGHDKILLEAWTKAAWDEEEERKERERLRILGELEEEEMAPEEPEEPESPQKAEKIQIRLQSSQADGFPVHVRKTNRISMLIRAFRAIRKLPEDRVIELWFDGEMLDPDQTVEQAGIEDEDTLEVHMKEPTS